MSCESGAVATGMINQIFNHFQAQLSSRELANKMPAKLQQAITEFTSELAFTSHFPKPNFKKFNFAREDAMPRYPPKQSTLAGCAPKISKSMLQSFQASSGFHRNSATSRYSSAAQLNPKRNVRLNLEGLKADKVVQLNNRSQQSTAKSFRSVIQLESHISQLRRTYLQNLKQEKLNQINKQPISPRPKKIPKQFTYDYNFGILERRSDEKKGTTRSPLKPKSISRGKVTKGVRNPELLVEEESNLEEELSRNPTGQPEKEKRVYNNASRRQVSHFPYIALTENSNFFENENSLRGPYTKKAAATSYQWKQHSHFKPFFQNTTHDQAQNQLLTENEEMVFPSTLAKQQPRKPYKQGMILKNSRYFKKSLNSEGKESSRELSVQFHPLNVTRNHVIDQYYKLKAVDQ